MRNFRILSEDTLLEYRTPRNLDADRLETIEEGYNPLSALKSCVEVTGAHAQRRVISIEELTPGFRYTDKEILMVLKEFYGDAPQFKTVSELLELAKVTLLLSEMLPGLRLFVITSSGEKSLQIQLNYADSPVGRFVQVPFSDLPDFRENSMEVLVEFISFIVAKSSDLI